MPAEQQKYLVQRKKGSGMMWDQVHLGNGAGGEALVHQPIVHKHVADAKDGDAKASSKAQAAKLARGEEAVSAEGCGGNGIDDGKDVICLKGAQPLLVMAFVQLPTGNEVMPQGFMGPSCPHLHANLQKSNIKCQTRLESCHRPSGVVSKTEPGKLAYTSTQGKPYVGSQKKKKKKKEKKKEKQCPNTPDLQTARNSRD